MLPSDPPNLAKALKTNSIGSSGALALSKALTTNSTLTILNLAGNSIGDNGAWVLSEAFYINSTLIILHLENNRIGDNGTQLLLEVSQAIRCLTGY
ncbi:hypothetical protein MVEG_01749 [Podila verticillata NRRL 6337]|nr:hypothetical protein MVEG_01749 [Podila verticillata NRRL 6337]